MSGRSTPDAPMPSAVMLCVLPGKPEFVIELPACVPMHKVVMVPKPQPQVIVPAQMGDHARAQELTPALLVVTSAESADNMNAAPKYPMRFRIARGKEPFDATDCEYLDSFTLNGVLFHLFYVSEE